MPFFTNKRFWVSGHRYYLLIDVIIFLLSPLLALLLRLDGVINFHEYQPGLLWATLLFLWVKLSLLIVLGFYRRCWRYASVDELYQIGSAMLAATVLQMLMFGVLQQQPASIFSPLPRSLPLLDAILSFLLVGAVRFHIRMVKRFRHRHRVFFRRDRVLIIGAGDAGVSLVQEMQRTPSLGLRPVAFVDDDPQKLHLHICGLSVAGNRHKILELVRSLHIRRVIIAMPTVPGHVIREIAEICQRAGVQTSTLPGIHEILNGHVSLGRVRDIQIEDLLRRESVQMDVQEVERLIQGKRVLITGAGGSIGSELCRQVLKCRPSELILLGHGENSIFTIQQELESAAQISQASGNASCIPRISAFIADIRFLPRLEHAFGQFQPHIVFHAAAHKHVPMMEFNTPEAVTNNVVGTQNLVNLALHYNVEHFVMISTDKAVNPTNVMGASKRVAEMLVLQAAQTSGRAYSVVRFGNVLGSRGSVVPTFKRQIAEGGPVTVTHPDICRYFMTIPEAVQLVLHAAAIGSGGQVFMLDMGKPVKIVDLARELIRLSGYEVGKTMQIAFTGLRPGEKLFEELFNPGEQYDTTQHEKLFIVTNASGIVPYHLNRLVSAIKTAALRNASEEILLLLEQLVPGFKPQYRPQPEKVESSKEQTVQPIKGIRSIDKTGDRTPSTVMPPPVSSGYDINRQAI